MGCKGHLRRRRRLKKKIDIDKAVENADKKYGLSKKGILVIVSLLGVLLITVVGTLLYYSNTTVIQRENTGYKKEVKKAEEVRETKVKEELGEDVIYSEDVYSFEEELGEKNGYLNPEETEKAIDGKFGEGIYDLYVSGRLPSNQMSGEEVSVLSIDNASYSDENYISGYLDKIVRSKLSTGGKAVDVKKNPYILNQSAIATYYPTEDGFKNIGNGMNVGYPFIEALNLIEEDYNEIYVSCLVYFDNDVEIKDLSTFDIPMYLDGKELSNMQNSHLQSFFKKLEEGGEDSSQNPIRLLGNFGYTYTTDADNIFINTVGQPNYANMKLKKGGIATYTKVFEYTGDMTNVLKETMEVEVGDGGMKQKVKVHGTDGDELLYFTVIK